MVTSGTKFNGKTLKKLLNSPNACVHHKKCTRHIALTPNALNDTKSAIRDRLNLLLTKFDSELDGVVLGFRHINVLSSYGSILDDSPDIHFDIDAEFYLFKPERGNILTGVVMKKSRDNIGCLVHDIFNASIPIDMDDGVGSVGMDRISIGEPLTFSVEEVNFTDSIPYIRGKLVISEEESLVVQADSKSDKKRKRGDDHTPRKKIKTDSDNSVSVDDNKYVKSKKSNDIEYLNAVNIEMENTSGNFKGKLSSKHPTSILKKSSSIGIENSPARRISFYGDAFGSPSKTHEIQEEAEGNKASGKTKKSKKESEHSYVEVDSVQSKKKKKKLYIADNETLQEEEILVETELVQKSGSTKEKKKKKKVNESTTNVVEDINLRDSEDPGQAAPLETHITEKHKTKNKKKKNERENEIHEFQSGNINEEDLLYAEDVTVQKKGNKSTILVENEYHESNLETEQLQYLELMPKTKEKRKKTKKRNELGEQVLETLENTGEIAQKKKTKKEESTSCSTDEVSQTGEKGRTRESSLFSDHPFAVPAPGSFKQRRINISPLHSTQIEPSTDDDNNKKRKKKKICSDPKDINISFPDDEHMESLGGDYEENNNKKKKKKKKSEVDIEGASFEQRRNNISPMHNAQPEPSVDDDNSKRNNKRTVKSDLKEIKTSFSDDMYVESLGDEKKKKKKQKKDEVDIGDVQREANVSLPYDTQVESTVGDDEKKKKKVQTDSGKKLYGGRFESASTLVSIKPAANSTVIANTTPSAKKNKHNRESDNSFDSLSPIRKPDGQFTKFDEDVGFITSTQIDTHPATENTPKSTKLPKVRATEKARRRLSTSNSESDLNYKQMDTVTLHRAVIGTNKLPFQPGTSALSDSSSCSSNHISLKRSKKSLKESTPTKNKGVQKKIMILKPAGSESSSSDTDVSSPVLAKILQKQGNQNREKPFQEILNLETADTDKDDSEENSVATKQDQNSNLQRTVLPPEPPHENNSEGDSSDSDLPFDRDIRKKLQAVVIDKTKRIQNQQPNVSSPEKILSAAVNMESRLAHEKQVIKGLSGDVSNMPIPEAYNEKLQMIAGSEGMKKNPALPKPGGFSSSSSDSDVPSNVKDTNVSPKKQNKTTTPRWLTSTANLQSPEKNVSDTDSIVKELLQKMKSEVLESSSCEKIGNGDAVKGKKRDSKLKSSVAGKSNQKKTSKSEKVVDPLSKEKTDKKRDEQSTPSTKSKHRKMDKATMYADLLFRGVP